MDDYDQDVESAWQNHAYAEPCPTAVLQFTTKIAPSFDGRVSWFSYEEAIDDWCGITELEQSKRGPALRNRLEGDAAVYKPLLDRAALAAPTGVTYLKTQLRQHFVKGTIGISVAFLSTHEGTPRKPRIAPMDWPICSAKKEACRFLDGFV